MMIKEDYSWLLKWRKSHEIGIEKIDNYHKELFKRIKDLLDACNEND
ncbi:hypothetical protein RBH29_07925 [Herbivorax sp. ANBcel31]|nr:hypothetical protein [Herbivorax sp. ANBcel31]MDQ2086355.1 hypothetical protein [Herbivorax sp. ANBcel31]